MITVELHGRTFNVEKRAGEWQTNYRDAKATVGASKIEVIDKLKAIGRDELIKECNLMDKQLDRDIYFKGHILEFTRIFGFAPPRDFLMYHCGFGFQLDVIALDKKLGTPDGISTNDYILNTYGQYALDMAKRMI